MSLGVLTEHGVSYMAAPIVAQHAGFFSLSIQTKENAHIVRLVKLKTRLVEVDDIKDRRKALRLSQEKERVLLDIIDVLEHSEEK